MGKKKIYMTREDFLRRLRKLARTANVDLVIDERGGAGSHYKVTYGDKQTTVPDGLKKGTFHGICKQLGIEPSDL